MDVPPDTFVGRYSEGHYRKQKYNRLVHYEEEEEFFLALQIAQAPLLFPFVFILFALVVYRALSQYQVVILNGLGFPGHLFFPAALNATMIDSGSII